MRIGFVSTFLPARCGIATYTDYLTRAIRNLGGVSITIAAECTAQARTDSGMNVIVCWDRKKDYVKAIADSLSGVDVVHIQHEYSIYSFDDRLPRLIRELKSKVPVVITIHCIRPAQFCERGTVDEEFAARIANLANRVIVHLDSQKSILVRLGVESDKISVIPHGTELTDKDEVESRKKLGLPLEAKILLMFGFIKKHKCLDIACEALKEIVEKHEDTYLFIAGGLAPQPSPKDVEYANLLDRKIEELGLQQNIIYPGKFFPNEDVPYLFRSADIVLFPYYEEDRSASGSLHLALGANRPIIASRIPKFEELRNVCDELLVLPFNFQGIAKIALRIFDDSKFRRYIHERTDKIRKETSWSEVARKHLEIYRKLLDKR